LSEVKNLAKLLQDLNANIQVLSKVTALTFRKDSIFKGKETKQEQIEVLDGMKLPDEIIALIIGSTPESVSAMRSQRKAKAKSKTKLASSETPQTQEAKKNDEAAI
jgi:hypothetical protein